MNRKSWYLLCCTIPFFVPLIFLERHLDMPLDLWQLLKMLMVFQLLYTGIPYLIFCACFLMWSATKTAEQIEKVAYLLPLFFTFFAEAGFVYIERMGFNFEYHKDPALVYLFFAAVVPLYGYCYLGFIRFLTWILEQTGAFLK